MNHLVNFRAIEGYRGHNGQPLKPRTLLRSGELFELDANDSLSLQNDYQLRTIVDFRGPQEVERRPNTLIPNTQYHHIDIMKASAGHSASMTDLMQSITHETAQQVMFDIYDTLVINPESQRGYHDFIQLLLAQKEEGAVLFHCFAGKDRTGLAAAIVLQILGVAEADIMHDYLITNTQRQQANAAIVAAAKSKGMDDGQLSALSQVLAVEADYLNHAFNSMQRHYGGFANYVLQALKLKPADLVELRRRYLSK
ncbi:MAG: tyrosine-protein phosphatase [Neisseriaceae bacterium]|nr:tyrosine-protein phosphatase [Neisseriaceae bacterium]